ncbi:MULTISPECIES: tripartite tricarboxylate transporter substrate binding protein [Bosea]|jgi:tripartite-type tricarboxylate transporter receptor subunit TctC|uniref:Bug family tripartite tricarboxylate transporter substrate binding protein n=1 Tax=Bosea TaxID=85413 RepID=UPI00214F908F|nr:MULTISPECIES: tripartite tricarboxylate transporter substrate binding protein [Bosea]MCR4520304.1 tripartite tricarboxylate transporter substrate binding protein [Bosea sp. 47.2.35]MDR6828673.1 tripartite-type tricarboxylate transporter receptor subunit TctC [Bosea robiniae]MDR6895332.1 tripartite-type tricarboxylate transporter receptor subunit TctC [Bosea sp. BE109]MDR7138728.1 tripartite-type tricarboxylate transporter receptor subunit TctC [Bosea sp. BE168]MDR7175297.1 tripartite-type t
MVTTLTRRHFGKLAAASALACPAVVQAQPAWPTKPVRILISFPPGGSSDFVARAITPALSEHFGQQFIVDNRPGAGGTVAGDILRREQPDGYTFLLSNNAPFTIAPTMFKKIPYNVVKDFTHVCYLGATYGGLVAHANVGVKTAAELIAKAKANPGQLSFGSSGVGSIGHITGNTFCRAAGIDILHVPYRGAGPLRIDLTAGIIGLQFEGIVTSVPQIAAGELFGLGVTSDKRLPAVPNIPTFREMGYDVSVKNWHGISAPANLPPAIAEKMSAALADICTRQAITDQFAKIGNYYDPMTSAEFSAFVADQIEVWRPMIIAAGAAGQ